MATPVTTASTAGCVVQRYLVRGLTLGAIK
jgi:ABC-type maltose transport system permease subunit